MHSLAHLNRSAAARPAAPAAARPAAAAAVAPLPAPLRPLRQHSAAFSSVAARASLKENVAALPAIDGVTAVRVSLPDGSVWDIPNAPGKAASARIYAHLAATHGGRLSAAAAREGLALYAEVTDEARAHPGSHPNIDLLLKVEAEGLDCGLEVVRS